VVVSREVRVGRERGEDASRGRARHRDRDLPPRPVEEDDVPLVEDARAGDEHALLALARKARRREPREGDRDLSELATEQADVRQHGPGEGERPGGGEDLRDVVGARAPREEDRPRRVLRRELGAVPPERPAREAGRDPPAADLHEPLHDPLGYTGGAEGEGGATGGGGGGAITAAAGTGRRPMGRAPA